MKSEPHASASVTGRWILEDSVAQWKSCVRGFDFGPVAPAFLPGLLAPGFAEVCLAVPDRCPPLLLEPGFDRPGLGVLVRFSPDFPAPAGFAANFRVEAGLTPGDPSVEPAERAGVAPGRRMRFLVPCSVHRRLLPERPGSPVSDRARVCGGVPSVFPRPASQIRGPVCCDCASEYRAGPVVPYWSIRDTGPSSVFAV